MRWPRIVLGRDEQRIEILTNKVRSMGRIINHVNAKNARLHRSQYTLRHAAEGQPTPRLVAKVRRIYAAAGTNSIPKIIELIERGKGEGHDSESSHTVDGVVRGGHSRA